MGETTGHSLWYVKHVDFFPSLSAEDSALCDSACETITVRKGAVVALAHETAHSAWLICEGRVRLVRHMQDGRTLAVDVLGPGEIVGEMAIVTGEAIPEGAEAVEDAVLMRVPAQMLREICGRNPALGLHIAKRAGLRRTRIETRLGDLLFTTVPVRIGKLLIQLADRFGQGPEDSPTVKLRMTHQDIGDLVGCSREAATKGVDQLVTADLIAYENRHIRIQSLERLGTFIQGTSAKAMHLAIVVGASISSAAV